jgi:hypothetical protein
MGIIGLTVGLILWIPCVILTLFMIGGLVTGICFSEYDTADAISCTFMQIIIAVVFAIPSVIGGIILFVYFYNKYEKKFPVKTIMKSHSKPIINTKPVLSKQTKVKSDKVKYVSHNTPLEILKERLAKGEITIDEYNEIKSALNS